MNTRELAESIAKALEDGIKHPGNIETKTPPAVMVLPMFRTHGRPPAQADNMHEFTVRLCEAILTHIETDCNQQIVPKAP